MSKKGPDFYSIHADYLELKRTQHHSVSLTFMGDHGVGKTSFLRAYASERSIQTLTIADITIDVHLMDTENILHHEELLKVWCKMTSLLVLCYDMTDDRSLDNWINVSNGSPTILIGTKLDLVKDFETASKHGEQLKQKIKAEAVIFTSAVQRLGLEEFKSCLTRILAKKLIVKEEKSRFLCFKI